MLGEFSGFDMKASHSFYTKTFLGLSWIIFEAVKNRVFGAQYDVESSGFLALVRRERPFCLKEVQ